MTEATSNLNIELFDLNKMKTIYWTCGRVANISNISAKDQGPWIEDVR